MANTCPHTLLQGNPHSEVMRERERVGESLKLSLSNLITLSHQTPTPAPRTCFRENPNPQPYRCRAKMVDTGQSRTDSQGQTPAPPPCFRENLTLRWYESERVRESSTLPPLNLNSFGETLNPQPYCCRAKMAHTRQSRSNSGLGVQAKFL